MSGRDGIEGVTGSALARSNVLGVRFTAVPLDDVRRAVLELLRSPIRDGRYLCPTGAHGVIEARKDAQFRRILNRAALNVPDGMPIVIASRLLGFPTAERAFGPELMLHVLRDSAPLGLRHFFYGGREGVAARLATNLQERIPGLEVAGVYCPPFRPLTEDEKAYVGDLINSTGTDVVWVGLSTPKQERWITEMRGRLGVKLMCGVGAAFDYHTGSIREAPRWMKATSLEWLFRLIQEPKRLWGRYAEIVPAFLALIVLQLTGLRRFPLDE